MLISVAAEAAENGAVKTATLRLRSVLAST
jgi:hypothetical protein